MKTTTPTRTSAARTLTRRVRRNRRRNRDGALRRIVLMEKQVASLAAEVARLRAVGANAATRPAKTEEENLAAFREVIERLQWGQKSPARLLQIRRLDPPKELIK